MKVVFFVGPTASGKSALALQLAEKFGGSILNSDSVQIYQDLLIGSAAPSEEEKKRVPHFLFQQVAAPHRVTAGDFSRMALETLKEREGKDPVVFVVGGTGFYLMALEKGMLPIEKADPEIQKEIEKKLTEENGPQDLHAELSRLDAKVGARISVNDHYRLVRALEIMRRTGRPLSEIEQEHSQGPSRFPYPLLKLGIQSKREELQPRIETRTRQMLQSGLIEEVQGLLDRSLADWEPLQSVGYKETLGFLTGQPDLQTKDQLFDKIVQNTLRLAKKQRTWFQRDPAIQWGSSTDLDFFASQVKAFLGE